MSFINQKTALKTSQGGFLLGKNFSGGTDGALRQRRMRPCLPAGRLGAEPFLTILWWATMESPPEADAPWAQNLWCIYCTKLEPIFKTNDVARAERVVA